MSWRSLVEINHDFASPGESEEEWAAWGRAMMLYVKSGDRSFLPAGFDLKWRRHHSDPCPFDQPLEFERRYPRSRFHSSKRT
jgi:hypothetical protein